MTVDIRLQELAPDPAQLNVSLASAPRSSPRLLRLTAPRNAGLR
jgi:hypothetical protein